MSIWFRISRRFARKPPPMRYVSGPFKMFPGCGGMVLVQGDVRPEDVGRIKAFYDEACGA